MRLRFGKQKQVELFTGGKRMKDVQSQSDTRNIPLKKVGIKELKWPIKVMDKNAGTQDTVGVFSLSVDLPPEVRGTHMSRFVEVVNELKSVTPKDLEDMMNKLEERLEARAAFCKIEFDYFIRKPSPVTGIISPFDVKCCFEAEKSDKFKFLMSVAIPASTLCPCSKEISEFGAHNQRATINIKIAMNKLVWIEDIVKIAEESASCPIYSLLKRKDEKYVTEMAYKNPRFVEDVVREAAIRLDKNPNVSWYSVYTESIESIHNHNAFAYTEKE
jgi:GTP cyclohydrolase I